MKNFKRMVALFFSLAMILTFMPSMVFADSGISVINGGGQDTPGVDAQYILALSSDLTDNQKTIGFHGYNGDSEPCGSWQLGGVGPSENAVFSINTVSGDPVVFMVYDLNSKKYIPYDESQDYKPDAFKAGGSGENIVTIEYDSSLPSSPGFGPAIPGFGGTGTSSGAKRVTATFHVFVDPVAAIYDKNGDVRTYSTTLEDAIAAVQDDETIELLENVDITNKIIINNGKKFTLDLNSKTLSGNGRTFDLQNAFLTVKNGTMAGASQPFNVYGSNDNSYAAGEYNSLTLCDDLTVDGDYAVILWYPTYGAPAYGTKIDVNGTTLNGNIWVLGAIEEGNSVINVNSGTTINVVSNDGDDVGIAVQGNATVNVNEGVEINAPTGIEVAGGTLNMTGGSVTGTAHPTSSQGNNNGTTTTGAGIAVAPYGYSTPTVNISGGVIKGYTALNIANPRNVTNKYKTPVVKVANGSFAAINGGTIAVADSVELAGFLYGGKYSSDPTAYLAAGCDKVAISENPYIWKVTMGSISGSTTTEGDTTITPVIKEDSATITPLPVTGNDNKETKIAQSDLDAFAESNEVDKVEIITGLSATQAAGSTDKAPQTKIVDENGDTIFEAVASGGQMRYDKKLDENKAVIGEYGSGAATKAEAIDYADVRLQFQFTLPEGVDIADKNTSWYWTLKYNNGTKDVEHRVEGVNYLPKAGMDNTYTSNVVVTNVPVKSFKATNFSATMNITYKYNGVTYTISQSSVVPLSRTVSGMVAYYTMPDVWKTLSAEVKTYITGLEEELK